MPGALSAEATLPPLNLLRYSKMGALLSGERGAGRRFGCLRPSTFQDQARLLQIPLCQEQHPAAAVPSSSLGSGQIPTCGLISPSALSPLGTHGRGARGQMRFGRGSKPCSMRPLCCFPSAPQQHHPAPELLRRGMEREPPPRARSRQSAPEDKQGMLEEAAGWPCHPRAAAAPWSRYSDIAEVARAASWFMDRLFRAGTCSLLSGPAQVSPVSLCCSVTKREPNSHSWSWCCCCCCSA